MSLINIGLLSLALSLDFGNNEWLITEVISGEMSMNTVRSAIGEYDLELPRSIKALQRQLIGLQKNAPVTKNVTALSPLPLAESDEEENDPDVPPLPSSNIDNEESDLQACPLPPVDIGEERKTRNYTSVTSHGFILALGSQVKNFFQGLGWFSGEVIDNFLDDGNMQIYTIIFPYDGE